MRVLHMALERVVTREDLVAWRHEAQIAGLFVQPRFEVALEVALGARVKVGAQLALVLFALEPALPTVAALARPRRLCGFHFRPRWRWRWRRVFLPVVFLVF